MRRLTSVSVTRRSRLIGSTSNDRIWRSTKPDTLASVRIATAYQALAGVTRREAADASAVGSERSGVVTQES